LRLRVIGSSFDGTDGRAQCPHDQKGGSEKRDLGAKDSSLVRPRLRILQPEPRAENVVLQQVAVLPFAGAYGIQR
jgi:hypothetical protein